MSKNTTVFFAGDHIGFWRAVKLCLIGKRFYAHQKGVGYNCFHTPEEAANFADNNHGIRGTFAPFYTVRWRLYCLYRAILKVIRPGGCESNSGPSR